MPDGRRHTFSQFGAGTLVETQRRPRTYLGPNVIIDPPAILREAEHLATLFGQKQTVSVGSHRATMASQTGVDPPYTVVRWQPSTGLWAEVSGSIDDELGRAERRAAADRIIV